MVQLSAQIRSRRCVRQRRLMATAALFFLAVRAHAQTGKLVPDDKARLLSCEASSTPSFRLQFNVVDPGGAPTAVALPSNSDLASSLHIIIDAHELTPFFAAPLGQTQSRAPTRTTLFLIDVSGSMNKRLDTGQTRFEAAKDALRTFLRGLRKGDQVAVVPFQSHRVRETIDSAAFVASPEEASQQVDDLPAPEARNNTALYSAFDLGLDKLKILMEADRGSSEFQLYVLTDGENDVGNPGDDPGLLSGDDGLKVVASKVRSYARIQVNAVGFGDPREVDEAALKEITNRFHMFTDATGLNQFFRPPAARPPVSQGIRATVLSPWPDRAWLAARTVHFRASLLLPTGQALESEDATWSAPEVGTPMFEGKCDPGEESALIEGNNLSTIAAWPSIIRPVIVFMGLASALLVLWFWVPRLVWQEQYSGTYQPRRDARWAPPTVAIPGPVQAARGPAPPGFEQEQDRARAPQRAPADATMVLPINKMGTRTRLELKRAVDDERR